MWDGDVFSGELTEGANKSSTDYRSWDIILFMTSALDDKIVNEVSRYSGSAP